MRYLRSSNWPHLGEHRRAGLQQRVDDQGRLTLRSEYEEAVGFLDEARAVADRLTGDHTGLARSLLDSIITAGAARRPPRVLDALEQRFSESLGSDGALEMPVAAIDMRRGARYTTTRVLNATAWRAAATDPWRRGSTPNRHRSAIRTRRRTSRRPPCIASCRWECLAH